MRDFRDHGGTKREGDGETMTSIEGQKRICTTRRIRLAQFYDEIESFIEQFVRQDGKVGLPGERGATEVRHFRHPQSTSPHAGVRHGDVKTVKSIDDTAEDDRARRNLKTKPVRSLRRASKS